MTPTENAPSDKSAKESLGDGGKKNVATGMPPEEKLGGFAMRPVDGAAKISAGAIVEIDGRD